MKTRASVAAAVLALAALGGCYIAPEDGGASAAVTASIPRSIVLKPGGYTVRAYLYPSRYVRIQYFNAAGLEIPAKAALLDPKTVDSVTVTAKSKPVLLDGYEYWEVEAESLLRLPPTGGGLTIVGIPPDVSFCLHLVLLDWSQRDPKTGAPAVYAEGLSEPFTLAAGQAIGLGVALFD